MSEIANYTFIPWVRQGIANQISGNAGFRATIPVEVTLSGEKVTGGTETKPPIPKDIQIYGPGDIVGIDQTAIINIAPLDWITNFEPNYLPYIEFYDEDFPWRYSPETPSANRLNPWIMLIVLEEGEYKDGKNLNNRPLPYITLPPDAPLPPTDQLWAWAHVHVNQNIIGTDFSSNDASEIQSNLDLLLRKDPDLAYSRILCPRRLKDNTAYHAFLVPVYETGRLAGLGKEPADAPAYNAIAWTAGAAPDELPYYYRWYFRTGTVGDFEYLVRLLEPKPVDSRVGVRDMDVQEPGANIRGIVDPPNATDDEKLNGILKLGGALRIPDRYYSPVELINVEKYRKWASPYPHDFQKDLAAFINLTDSYAEKSAEQANSDAQITEVQAATDPKIEFDIGNNPDPLITAPLYGRWHSLTERLLKDRQGGDLNPNDNWVHDLNLDPRWRVAAGFGTKVVQENQENYMKAAWDQVGEVLDSNQRIRHGQYAKEASWVWHQVHLKPLEENNVSKWLSLAAPLQARVINQGVTVSHQVNVSQIPKAVFSPAMRKLMRPRGRLVRRLPFDKKITPDNLVERLNDGQVSAAPPRQTPAVQTLQDVADSLKPGNLPGPVADLVEKYAWLKWLALVLAFLIMLVLIFFSPDAACRAVGLVLIAGLYAVYRWLNQISQKLGLANSILEENQTPEAVDHYPPSPDFKITQPGEEFRPSMGGGEDNDEAKRFKAALKNVNWMIQESHRLGVDPVKPKLDLPAVGEVVFAALDPEQTIPNWVWGNVVIPARIKDQLIGNFVEVMAYPEIDLPMYKPLADYSSELFLPNINYISENSISILETNQKFIEAYMIGLNHEMARELVWREYPTDSRGSYFRQFWEAQSYYDDQNLDPEALKEKLKDIPQIHKWLKKSDLGDHDNREVPGEKEEEVVLVIRGELLKKYPNAIIYAQKAVWQDKDSNPILDMTSGQTIDLTQERELRPLSEGEKNNPPRTIIKTPLYEARVAPDITFFGFDLTVCEAVGGTGDENDPVDQTCADEGILWSDPGWFFVIKEPVGEISLGLDVPSPDDKIEDVKVWNDLSWNHPKPAVSEGDFLQINQNTVAINLIDSPALTNDENEKQDQKDEDINVVWSKDMSSADLAYILYQVPILVAVHSSEMLPKD